VRAAQLPERRPLRAFWRDAGAGSLISGPRGGVARRVARRCRALGPSRGLSHGRDGSNSGAGLHRSRREPMATPAKDERQEHHVATSSRLYRANTSRHPTLGRSHGRCLSAAGPMPRASLFSSSSPTPG
jgi:hypothetical protein